MDQGTLSTAFQNLDKPLYWRLRTDEEKQLILAGNGTMEHPPLSAHPPAESAAGKLPEPQN